jgi:putative ABC transport system permease protein
MRLPLWLRWRSERDLEDEIQTHVEFETQANIDRGMTPEEARFAAMRAFGNATRVRERAQEADPMATIQNLTQDIRYALRLWRKNPSFALAAVTAIGLGIGVNTAVFTLANAVLLKAPAYEGDGRLVYLQGHEPGCDLPCDIGRSYADFLEFRAHAASIEELAGYSFETVNLSDSITLPERYRSLKISANASSVFGQKPLLGRDFTSSDEQEGATSVVMLTYAIWQARYGGDPSIIGKSIRVNEVPSVVIGVMRPSMQFRVGVDLWMPLVPTGNWRKREHRNVMMIARLKKDTTAESARAELDTISRRLESSYPVENKAIGLQVLEGKDYFNPRMKTILFGLWTAVGLVLLVACANVANLHVGRAVVRAREMSIRMAIGAGRWRVVRQLLAESLTLSIAGGILGWLLAIWGVRLFDVAIAGSGKPPWLDFSMDYTVFAYLSVISLGTGILFGLIPALQMSRIDIHSTLKDGGHGARGGVRGRHLASVLVVSEIAMTVLLLVATVVAVRTMLTLHRSQTGVNPTSVLTMVVDLPERKYSRPGDRISFYEQLQERVKGLPGVKDVSIASTLPGHGANSFAFELEGSPPADASARPRVRGLVVGPAYFRTMDVKPMAGREFTEAEGPAGQPAVVVNRSFAAQHSLHRSPIGQRLRLFENGVPQRWLTVVGLVPDVWQNDEIRREFQPLIYLPFTQRPRANMYVVARTAVPPTTLGRDFRKAVQALDENLPVIALRTLQDDIELHDWAIRVFGTMFGIFSLIAMVLASVGLYAVVAHSVNRRTQEIGVRLAMGATPARIMASVFAQGMGQVALGLGVGLIAAFGLMRALRSLLAGVFEADIASYMVVALALAAAGVLACSIPAFRATRVDPVDALRLE